MPATDRGWGSFKVPPNDADDPSVTDLYYVTMERPIGEPRRLYLPVFTDDPNGIAAEVADGFDPELAYRVLTVERASEERLAAERALAADEDPCCELAVRRPSPVGRSFACPEHGLTDRVRGRERRVQAARLFRVFARHASSSS